MRPPGSFRRSLAEAVHAPGACKCPRDTLVNLVQTGFTRKSVSLHSDRTEAPITLTEANDLSKTSFEAAEPSEALTPLKILYSAVLRMTIPNCERDFRINHAGRRFESCTVTKFADVFNAVKRCALAFAISFVVQNKL